MTAVHGAPCRGILFTARLYLFTGPSIRLACFAEIAAPCGAVPTGQRLTPQVPRLTSVEEPHYRCQQEAEQDTGGQRKVKREVSAPVGDVARESPERRKPSQHRDQHTSNQQ